MSAFANPRRLLSREENSAPYSPDRPRWDLAFLGVLSYLLIEYTRLAAMFPRLQPFQVGKIAVGLSLLGIILSGGRMRATSVASGRVDLALLLFFFASFVSACFADYSEPAWSAVFNIIQLCTIYFIISRTVTDSWRIRIFTFLYLLLNLKLAQFAIRGYFSGKAMGLSGEYIAGHGFGAGTTGFFGNQGDFGVAMCVVWPLAGSLFMGEARKGHRYFWGICSLIFLGAIVVSSSRGAMVSTAVVALISFLKNPKRMAGVLAVLLVLLTFLYVVPEASKARMRSALHPESDRTATTRINLWKGGLKMFYDHPILGVGPGNFPPAYLSEHPSSDPDPQEWAPHSIYLQGLAELGVTGTLPLLAIWALLFRMNARTRDILRSSGPEGTRRFEYRLSTGLDFAFLGYLVSGAFLTVLYYPHLWVLLGLSTGLLKSCLRERSEKRASEPELVTRHHALAAI